MELFAYNPADPPWEIVNAAHAWCIFWIVVIEGAIVLAAWICWRIFCNAVGWTDDDTQA